MCMNYLNCQSFQHIKLCLNGPAVNYKTTEFIPEPGYFLKGVKAQLKAHWLVEHVKSSLSKDFFVG